jgi:hypothetical protein
MHCLIVTCRINNLKCAVQGGVAELKASLLQRVNAFHYRSWHAFKADFDNLMRKHCNAMSAGSAEALKGQMSTLLGRYKAMCGDPSGDPKKVQGYATLTQVRDELCASLKSSEYVFFKPEAEPAASVQVSKAWHFPKSFCRQGKGL